MHCTKMSKMSSAIADPLSVYNLLKSGDAPVKATTTCTRSVACGKPSNKRAHRAWAAPKAFALYELFSQAIPLSVFPRTPVFLYIPDQGFCPLVQLPQVRLKIAPRVIPFLESMVDMPAQKMEIFLNRARTQADDGLELGDFEGRPYRVARRRRLIRLAKPSGPDDLSNPGWICGLAYINGGIMRPREYREDGPSGSHDPTLLSQPERLDSKAKASFHLPP